MSAAFRKPALAAIALLALIVILCLGAELFTITAHVLKNYNEGWNAYHAVAALADPASLYPAPSSFFTNNYPPLSFVLAGALGKLTGDALIAGRLIAFAATLGTGLCLGLAARAMGCRRGEAALAALLFWAAPWVIVRFSAMDDPQFLGNFLDAAGLAVLLRRPKDARAVIAGALFFTLAEFVKPLYVTAPLAALAWLFFYHRRSAGILTAGGIGFAMIGYGLTVLAFHAELLGHLFSPRLFLWSKLTGQPGQWLVVEALPLLASLLLLRRRGDGFAIFAGLYAVLAFVLAVFFSGGDGVSASQMMDPAMAVALGGALWFHHARQTRLAFPALGLVAVLQAAMLVLSFLGLFASRPSLPELMGARYATRYDIQGIARQKGPVLCEMLSLCYWAGQPAEVDAFGLTQAVRRHARAPDDLIRRLDAKDFAMIQLQTQSQFAPPSVFWPAIVRNYYLEHQDKNGLFLIPRTQLPLFPPRR